MNNCSNEEKTLDKTAWMLLALSLLGYFIYLKLSNLLGFMILAYSIPYGAYCGFRKMYLAFNKE